MADYSVLCSPALAKLPNLRNRQALGNVVRNTRKGNRTDDITELARNPSLKLACLKKQKTSKDMHNPTPEPEKCFHALAKCRQPTVEYQSTHHVREQSRERAHRSVLKPAHEKPQKLFEPPVLARNGPEAIIHKRKLTLKTKLEKDPLLGLPNEDSYKLMVGLFRDIRRIVKEPEIETLASKLGIDRENSVSVAGSGKLCSKVPQSHPRKSVAAGVDSVTHNVLELTDELNEIAEFATTKSKAPFSLEGSARLTKPLRPLTEETAQSTMKAAQECATATQEFKGLPREPEQENAQEASVSESQGELELIVAEMCARMGNSCGKEIALAPGLASAGAIVDTVRLSASDVCFVEPIIIPANVHCYDK